MFWSCSCGVSDLAGADEVLLAGARGNPADADRIGREVGAQPSCVGQLASVEVSRELTDEFGLGRDLFAP